MTAEEALKIADGHFKSGRFVRAESICRQVLSHQPGNLDALQLASVLAARDGRLGIAIELIGRAIAIRPDKAEYHNNLGVLHRGLGQLDKAESSLRAAISLEPGNAEAHFNLGLVLSDEEKVEEAIAEYGKALLARPGMVPALISLGNALVLARRFRDAAEAFEKAIKFSPDSVEAHWNLGLELLRLGEYERGWEEHEWRWRVTRDFSPPQAFAQPLWDGSDLGEKTILIHAEQAFGDTLQFARYVPMATGRGGRVMLQVQPELANVMKGLEGAEAVVTRGAPLPRFDVHCPLLSLPRLFGTRLDTIPSEVPYLKADAKLTEQWARRMEPYRDRFKVGLVWSGRQADTGYGNRSIMPEQLESLSKVNDVVFISLQKDAAPGQSLPAGMNLIDWTVDLKDFADTAALMANLNLVITVDTAVAHLAGAMGKPVWVLLRSVSDWRWLVDRDDSPWYPTMRLFRQPAPGDWASVIGVVTEALKTKSAWKE
jgi:tetratricopeptide (TPR) repeat protein